MSQRARTPRPLASAIGVALSLTLLAPAGFSPATAAPEEAPPTVQAQNVASFSDVSSRHVFYREISWMGSAGISNGWTMKDGTRQYRPAQRVLRDQMAAFMYRLAGSPEYTPPAVSPFTDVRPGQPFYKEITWLAENGISTGWAAPGGTRIYGPGRPVMRDQMAAFMYRLAGSPDYTAPMASKFTDVRPGKTFYKEIAWLAENGISTGWAAPGGTRIYGPGGEVMRDQMAAFMYRLDSGGHMDAPEEDVEPLLLSDVPLPSADVGAQVEWSLSASGGTKPYTFEVLSGFLPHGLSLDADTGLISGTPIVDEKTAVTVKVSDARGLSTTAAFVLVVQKPVDEDPLRMASKTVSVEVGEKDAKQLVAGGTAPYNLERTSGNIPDGLSFNRLNGTISGIPTLRSDEQVGLKITDSDNKVISSSVNFSVAKRDIAVVRPDGTVWEWTANPKHPEMHAPKQRDGIHDAKQVAVSHEGTYVLRADGTVWGWGSNFWTPLGNPEVNKYTGTPVRIGDLAQVTQIGATASTMFAVRASNWIYGWGVNRDYLLSAYSSINVKVEQPTNLRDPWSNSHIETGPNSVYAMGPHGGVVAWGKNDCNQFGDQGWDPLYPAPYSARTVISEFSNVKSVAAGNCTFYGQKTDGSVWAWGDNTGDVPATGGPRAHRATPGPFTDISDVKQLDVGGRAVYALKNDGTVWAWGRSSNNGFDLGTGRARENYPVQLKSLANITKVWAEDGRGFALDADGTIWGWGQLGSNFAPNAPNGMTATPVKLTF